MAVFSHTNLTRSLFLKRRGVRAGSMLLLLIATGGLHAFASEDPLPESPGESWLQQDARAPSTTAISPQTEAERKAELEKEQSKRILGIIPNFRSVSVDDRVPPLSAGQKFKLAAKNSLDYSTFVSVGIVAAISQARDTYPEFGQGGVGYGRRYWHSFTNQALANTTTVFLLPALTHEDPRYFTLGKGTFTHRALYAVSRLVVTRSDSGKSTANISEILGRGSAAGISVFYYPSQYQTFSEVAQRWGIAMGIDAGFNGLKEFWPDIRYKLTGGRK